MILMGNNCLRIENIRELKLFKRGSRATPKEIFDTIYSPLNPLIDRNIQLDSKPSHERNRSHFYSGPEIEAISKKCREAEMGLAAIITLDNGSRQEVQIRARTNYSPALIKSPNIVYLISRDNPGHSWVLREARSYDLSSVTGTNARRIFGDHFRKDSYEPGRLNPAGLSLKKSDIVLIPESILIPALEQVYLEGISQRITPRIKVAQADDSRMWYLREFLPAVRDMPLGELPFPTYAGNLNGLGLMDTLDSCIEQYCLFRGSVVNIDPDFWAYTPHQLILDNVCWGDLKECFGVVSNEKLRAELSKRERRESMLKVKNALGDSHSFLDYLPDTPISSSILGSLALDNIHT